MILEIKKNNVVKSYPWIEKQFQISSQTNLLWLLGFAGRFNAKQNVGTGTPTEIYNNMNRI